MPDKAEAEKIHGLAIDLITDAHKKYLEELQTHHDIGNGAIFTSALLFKAAIFAIDVGMTLDVFLTAAKEIYEREEKNAQKFS